MPQPHKALPAPLCPLELCTRAGDPPAFLRSFLDTIHPMKPTPRLFLALAAVSLFFLLSRPLAAQNWSLQDTTVITDVNVVDVRTGEVRADQVVILEGNRIVAVGSRKEMRYPRNAPIILNGRGSFLIPGLWDMHVHLVFGDWFPFAQRNFASALRRKRHHRRA